MSDTNTHTLRHKFNQQRACLNTESNLFPFQAIHWIDFDIKILIHLILEHYDWWQYGHLDDRIKVIKCFFLLFFFNFFL